MLRVAKTAELDALARDEGAVWVKGGATMKNFRIYADMLYNYMTDDPQALLCRGKPGCGEDAGRRRVPRPDHVLPMYLERVRHATPRSVPAHAHGISRSGVGKHSDCAEAFLENLPAGDLAERTNGAPTVEGPGGGRGRRGRGKKGLARARLPPARGRLWPLRGQVYDFLHARCDLPYREPG